MQAVVRVLIVWTDCPVTINISVVVAFLRKLIAVPIRLIAELLEIVGVFDTVPLLSACWKLTRIAEDGSILIVLMCRKHGTKCIRELAKKILVEMRDSGVAATIGTLEYAYEHNVEEANRWLKIAKDNGYKNQELLLHLELLLSNFFDEYDKEAIIDKILSRNDLPAHTTMAALIDRGNFFLENQQWEEAEQIAERVLSIQEQPDARIIKWVVYMRKNDKTQADKNFEKSKKGLPERVFNYIVAQGWVCLGDAGKAMEWLYKSDYDMFYIRESRSPVGQLARSEEFMNYCRERENR